MLKSQKQSIITCHFVRYLLIHFNVIHTLSTSLLIYKSVFLRVINKIHTYIQYQAQLTLPPESPETLFFYFFYVGPPKENIFLTTFYGLNFSSMLHMLQISIWASEGNFHYLTQCVYLVPKITAVPSRAWQKAPNT